MTSELETLQAKGGHWGNGHRTSKGMAAISRFYIQPPATVTGHRTGRVIQSEQGLVELRSAAMSQFTPNTADLYTSRKVSRCAWTVSDLSPAWFKVFIFFFFFFLETTLIFRVSPHCLDARCPTRHWPVSGTERMPTSASGAASPKMTLIGNFNFNFVATERSNCISPFLQLTVHWSPTPELKVAQWIVGKTTFSDHLPFSGQILPVSSFCCYSLNLVRWRRKPVAFP